MISTGNTLKRILDVVLVLAGSVFWVPLVCLLAIMIRFCLGSPVLFRQLRPGLNGKPFRMYKFRTMTDRKDTQGNLLPDEKRLTMFGKILRATSLDELPEFLNVLIGDMSLIGPRPLLMQYLSRYTTEQARRHEVLPGITGWAQIHGRNAISWEEKFKYDVWYADHWSLRLDFKIFFMTIMKVVAGEGITQKGQATVQEFFGEDGQIKGK